MSDFALPRAALVDFLKKKRPKLHAKANELRESVEKWLSYVPATYAHFTEHTVNHSDEIIKQASNLLFEDQDPTKPVLEVFSGSEAYLLIASAYLHDVGMVVSDENKERILESQEWKDWTSGGGAKRHAEIRKLREEKGGDEDVHHFRADVQMRYLLADFLRRSHHIRSAELILPEQGDFGRFGFDDPVAIHTISNICAGHGLHHLDLEDSMRFPSDTDVLDEPVNVRLIAILLRLGDLLDLRHNRACPLLMNAASPLPADSVAHWTQYQCFTKRTTRPGTVRIAAECRTLDEHRVIRDWCQWIVEEVHNARKLAARFERHKSWQPPDASIDGQSASISIERAAGAKYIWSDWKFELDQAGVIERLTHDLYESPNDYIRELLQNAFDATRCKMYADLKGAGGTPPEYPTQVDKHVRERYPINILLEERQKTNEHTNESETRQYLIVEDRGIGMDREIIERYFLQISRSYYVTPEFRSEFGFVPASRFGVGFLSVFAVSANIVVDTFKPSSDKAEQIRLTLTGPRNYLLTEKSERKGPGTRIEVELRAPLKRGELTKLVEDWCFRVEFPVFVNDLDQCRTVVAEKPEDLRYDISDHRKEGARFVRRCFPITIPGIEGEIYVETEASAKQSHWRLRTLDRDNYLQSSPTAHLPETPHSVFAACGVRHKSHSGGGFGVAVFVRTDVRNSAVNLTLSRTGMRGTYGPDWWDIHDGLKSQLCDILFDHVRDYPFRTQDERWRYLKRVSYIHLPTEFVRSAQGAVRLRRGRRKKYYSVNDACEMQRIFLLVNLRQQRYIHEPTDLEGFTDFASLRALPRGALWLDVKDLNEHLHHSQRFLLNRRIDSVSWLSDSVFAIGFGPPMRDCDLVGGTREKVYAHELANSSVVGFCLNFQFSQIVFALNSSHEFVAWLRIIGSSTPNAAQPDMRKQQLRLLSMILGYMKHDSRSNIKEINQYVHGFREIPGLPKELHPPDITLTDDMFRIKPGDKLLPLPDGNARK